MTDSFILGISTGSACLLTCGLAMFPYFMSGQAGVKRITADISVFLFTRLIAYILIATVAWYFGKTFFSNNVVRNIVPGVLYIVFAIMLVWYSIGKNRERHCPGKIVTTVSKGKLVPVLLGLVNSIGFCPALFLVITKGTVQDNLIHSYLSFLAFFAGSALWFLPVPFAGIIKRRAVLETIGILATALAGVIFMIKGLTNLIGGFIYG
jgi:hypothetical protein